MGQGRVAILAGRGALPRLIQQANPDAFVVTFKGVEAGISGHAATFEKLGGLFETLKRQRVTRVVFAGSMSRPALNPVRFDSKMIRLAPKLLTAMKQGDDTLLRTVVSVFEDAGFTVIGAHQAAPDLTAAAGLIAGPKPKKQHLVDACRAVDILTTTSTLDLGQACVVGQGLCYGVETIQGTDALLDFVKRTPQHLRRDDGGILFKAPKKGQELRVDMPAIGADTMRNAAEAGLSGVVIEANKVLLLDRPAIEKIAVEEGIFLLAQEVA
ncbi:MAG: UDP-2,3-diacylglucosamine diphosphatase LpxI [Pseudoruegeria sp.]